MITYVRDEKEIFTKCNLLSAILKSVDTFVIVATTYTSASISITEFELIVVQISTGGAYGLSKLIN